MTKCKTRVLKVQGYEEYGFPKSHPFKKERPQALFELTRRTQLNESFLEVEVAEEASEEALTLYHAPEYLRFVRFMSDRGEGHLDYGDTPAYPKCYEINSRVVNASIIAASLALSGEHGANFYGGMHHARADRASGFCIFNDATIALRWLLNAGARKIAYIDIDAHHGDGVMYAFYSEPRVLHIDFHEDGRTLFPGTGFVNETGEGEAEGTKVNIALPPGASDPDYRYAYDELVHPLLENFSPDIIVLQAGVDAHQGDPLTHLLLRDAGYSELYTRIHSDSHKFAQGKLCVLGGGGYNVCNVIRCWALLICELIGHDPPDNLVAEASQIAFEVAGSEPDCSGIEPSRSAVLAGTEATVAALRKRVNI